MNFSRNWGLVLACAVVIASATGRAGAGTSRPGAQAVLYGMSAVSATDGWAVGSIGRLGPPKTVALHWNGKSWRRVKTPSPHSDFAFLTASSRVSAKDAWAVGPGIILHWDGTSWKDAKAPVASDYLTGVSALSPTDAWAVGHAGLVRTSKAVVLHWDGTSWKPAKIPTPGSSSTLAGVSERSAKDVWAVGSSGPSDGRLKGSKTFALHWDGVSWKTVKVPSRRPGAKLFGVSARSKGDVWAVGGFDNTGIGAIILHWNGRSWRSVRAPRAAGGDNQLLAVSARASRDAWAVGSSGTKTMTVHWNGHSWRAVKTPSPGGPGTGAILSGVSARSPGRAWAVGDYGTRSGGAKVLILRWNGHRWIAR